MRLVATAITGFIHMYHYIIQPFILCVEGDEVF